MTQTIPPAKLLDDIKTAGFDVPSAHKTACAGLDRTLNLNAIAIALGLEKIAYEPGEFPGLIYEFSEYNDAFAVLFGTGNIFIAGGSSVDPVEAANLLNEKLEELDLVDSPQIAPVAISRSPETVPVPPEYDTAEEI